MCDGSTQTDLSLSDITNFEVYKDWYVTESWTAFAQFAKFRKDILKQVKDEYVTKFKLNKKSTKRKAKGSDAQSPKTKKRQKVNENTEFDFGCDDCGSDANQRTSLQKTCEIIVKTNRVVRASKRTKTPLSCNEFQEFSCQAILEKPSKSMSLS